MKRTTAALLCMAGLCAAYASVTGAADEREVAPAVSRLAPDVDAAVDRGLAYLGRVQRPDGTFPGENGGTAGVVGLCGMAFLAKGYTPGHGPYGQALDRCIDYVVKGQAGNGYLGGASGKMYSHCIATLFLLEVSGMVDADRQGRIDGAVPKATHIILAAQQVRKDPQQAGGWRYAPDSGDSDLSCSGWALLALRSARLNGVPVPNKAIEDAVAYLMRYQDAQTGQFGYQNPNQLSVTLTGAGLLCLELTGHHGSPETLRAGDYLANVYEQLPGQPQCQYGLYYTAQAMFQLGGKYWDKFSTWMYEYWLPKQRDDGAWPGWSPHWGAHGEVPYITAMTVLSFTVPYRQLPIYQRDETVDEER